MDRMEKVKEQAEKSGFPLEVEVVSTLVDHHWDVLHSTTYLDDDENTYREIDLVASKVFEIGRMSVAPNWRYRLVRSRAVRQ